MERIAIATDLFSVEPEGMFFTGARTTFMGLIARNPPEPGMPGSQLARWLQAALVKRDYQPDEPVQKDYGWSFSVEDADGRVDVHISFCVPSGEELKGTPEWVISVDQEVPIYDPAQYFVETIDPPSVDNVFRVLKNAIAAETRIKVIEIQ